MPIKGNCTAYGRKQNRAKVLDKMVTFAATQDQLDLLQKHARAQGMSVSAMIRNSLCESGYLSVSEG